jgi:hypothetical protein
MSSLSETVCGIGRPFVSGKNDIRNPAMTLTTPKMAIGTVGWIEDVWATKGAAIPPALANTELRKKTIFRLN